ncbi:MAG: hypothetical protein K2W96_09100 [Gemmataceae bacterium]|nr:hypothetical protein [Gemmataceae bacterium]
MVLILGGAGIVQGLSRLGKRAIACEEGFVDCGLFGARAWRRDEVEAIHESHVRAIVNGSYSHTVHEYAPRVKDQTIITFNQLYDGILLLGKRLQAGVEESRWPRAVADLDAGEWVGFGPIRASRWGIGCGRDEIPWREVEELAVDKGELPVYRRFARGTWARVGLVDIPSLGLFNRLLGRVSEPPGASAPGY